MSLIISRLVLVWTFLTTWPYFHNVYTSFLLEILGAYDSATLTTQYTFLLFPWWPMNGKSINYNLYKTLKILPLASFILLYILFLESRCLLSHYFPLDTSVSFVSFSCLPLSVLSSSVGSTLWRYSFSVTPGLCPWKRLLTLVPLFFQLQLKASPL